MIRRVLAGAASAALVAGIALVSTPAQALTGGAACADGAAWDWSISNPARYQAGPHEAVVGLSEAKRTVTIHAPVGCAFDPGDTWRVYNGYFSAEGTIEAGTPVTDSDAVSVEVPSSNAVAGDDIGVHLKVSDPDTPGWEVDKFSSVAPVNLLRRALFKYHTTDNRINFTEPYVADEPIHSAGNLIRASWSSHAYFGYEGRPVIAQTRADLPAAPYSNDADTVLTGGGGAVNFSFTVDEPGGPVAGDTFLARAKYNGNGTTSGNWSTGDRIAPAA